MAVVDPCLVRSVDATGRPVVRLGAPLLDEYLDENQRLVEAVFDELAEREPDGFTYKCDLHSRSDRA